MADERQGYVERLAAELTAVGFPRMPARVFTALLVTDDGWLTSAELADQLRASPAAISGAVRYLEQINVVFREREPGSRRDRYRLYDDVLINSIRMRDQSLQRLLARFKEGVGLLGEDTPAGERMAETLDFFTFMTSESEGLVRRWQERRERLRGQSD